VTKKVDTWMPLLVDKYLGDTTHLTTEQHGAYMLLLMAMWKRDGQLSVADGQLAAITRLQPARWKVHRPVLMEFFTVTDEHLTQKRLSEELERAKRSTEAKAEAGAKGAAKRWQRDGEGDGRAMAEPLTNRSRTDASIPTPKDAPSERKAKPSASSAQPTIPCPYQSIVDLFHKKLPSLPKVKLMPDARQKALRKLWGWVLSSSKANGDRRATTAEQALAWIGDYFARAADNDFLMGRGEKSGTHANWRCDIDFLLTDKGMRHVIEKTEAAAA
jgi:uncharacterized protein YdaU (DUF1376 family)